MTELTILTREGYKKLEDELEHLRTTRRAEIADKIRVARGFGDLSENAEYDAAKEEQAQVEERIFMIENQLKNATIIEENDDPDDHTVKIGSTVKVLDVEFNEEMRFTIVGTIEANPRKNRISNESPLGRALIGASEGEMLQVNTPNGLIEYKVIEIVKHK